MGVTGWTIDDDEIERVYGAWVRRTPTDAAELFADYPGTWWVAGGWAIEAFTGVSRPHHDCDPCALRVELDLLRDHLRGRYDVWSASSGALRPVFETWEGTPDELLLDGAAGLWLRPAWNRPWEYDVLLSRGDTETWAYRRDPSIRLPMAEALWVQDGIPYLRPEIQLLYKARGLRPQDQADFDVTVPLLEKGPRDWLADCLRRTELGHPWLAHL